MQKTCLALIASGALSMWSAAAAAQPEATLGKCSKTAGKEVSKYASAYQKAAGNCLNKIVKEIVVGGATEASGAAKTCVASLRKIVNTEAPDKTLAGRFKAKVGKICDPTALETKAQHGPIDVLGTTQFGALHAAALADYCAYFGGDGSIDSVAEWIDCQEQVASCGAQQQLSAAYPRAAEFLSLVRGEIVQLDDDAACGSPCDDCDDPKVKDACNALDVLEEAIDEDGDDVPDVSCGPPSGCGNGVLDDGEQCELGIDPPSCTDLGYLLNAQPDCAAGCVADTSMCESKLAFITSTSHLGNLGGVAGADLICATRASAAGFSGTFLAWIADGTATAPASRFTQSSVPYVLANGTKLADNWSDLTDGSIDTLFNVTETGATVGSGTAAWTKVQSSGSSGGIDDCSDWGSSSSLIAGNVGSAGTTSASWTSGGLLLCSDASRLYCFEQ